MSDYTVQVYHNGNVEYRKIQASSYEEVKSIVAAELTVGRIIAIVKHRDLPAS